MRPSGCVAIAALLTLGVGPRAAVAATDETATIEEIVVTARKREEGLLDTPLSVSALTAADLADGRLTTSATSPALSPISH